MVKYVCQRCGKEFKQKSHYEKHLKRKTPCEDNKNKIKEIVDKSVEEKISQLMKDNVIPVQKDNRIRIASMFAGCGGLDYAFHNNDKFNVVYVNDFDQDSCDTYEHNFKYKPHCEDIKKIKDIPDCDIITGGFPCQGFSLANTYRNESDSRNELYKELVRLLCLKKPKYFIFENVKGILSLGGYETNEDKKNRKGKIFKMIVKELEECGYKVNTKLFKMKWYDIPQNRERVIFFGIRNDVDVDFEWPEETQTITKTLRDAIGDLPVEYNPAIQHIGTKHKVKITGYLGNRILDWDAVAPTVTGRGGGTGGPVINVHPSQERRMTVREYARIQTFPDDFKFSGCVSSMYRQIGNAVPAKFSSILANLVLKLEK